MQTTNQIDEPIVANDALKFAYDVVYGYIHKITDRFKPGIEFTDRGLARAASTLGWIVGIAAGGNVSLANDLADDFIENLDYLSKFGGTVDYTMPGYGGESRTVQIPAYTVKLCDDGTAHGFAVLWNRPLLDPEVLKRYVESGREPQRFGLWKVPHAFAFNGGLIYHGPGAGQTFSVSLTSRLWSVHT
jgi:hypothetical protein